MNRLSREVVIKSPDELLYMESFMVTIRVREKGQYNAAAFFCLFSRRMGGKRDVQVVYDKYKAAGFDVPDL